MKKRISASVLAVAADGQVGCEQPAETDAETQLRRQAERVRETANAKAERLKERGDAVDPRLDGNNVPSEHCWYERERNVRDEGARQAETLEDRSDRVSG